MDLCDIIFCVTETGEGSNLLYISQTDESEEMFEWFSYILSFFFSQDRIFVEIYHLATWTLVK